MDLRLPEENGKKLKRESFRIEHDKLVNEIIIALNATGLGRFWSQPTGAAYRNNTLIRYGVKGSADISGIIIGGKRIEVEVKTGKAVQEEQQVNFQRVILSYGGIYFVARSVHEALHSLKFIAASVQK